MEIDTPVTPAELRATFVAIMDFSANVKEIRKLLEEDDGEAKKMTAEDDVLCQANIDRARALLERTSGMRHGERQPQQQPAERKG
jgi:hypothetical protein